MVFFLACCCPRRRTRRHFRHHGRSPTYNLVIRSQSRLLTATWEQQWDIVRDRCRSHPEEAFCRSQNNFRTALHLATMPGVKCPVWALQILIEANPHAVLMEDSHMFGGTPLHFVCGSCHRNNPRVIQLFVDTAVQMEQQYKDIDMRVSGWSPLFLAARRVAPNETLEILVQSRRHTRWIAPWTGGETIEYIKSSWTVPDNESPLQTLWINGGELPTRLSTDLKCRMREVARLLLDQQSSPTTTDDYVITGWTQYLILLREHCKSSTSLVHHVACLYQPIVGLLQLVCDLYPELLMTRNSKRRIPLHALLHHQRRTEMLRELVGILVRAQPESLTVAESGLYPCCLAAAQDASLDTIFYMLTTFPQVLEFQRQQEIN